MEIILVGAGGCMRELVWQMQEQNKQGLIWDIKGFVDRDKPENGKSVCVGQQEIPYLGDDTYLENIQHDVQVAIAVGSPMLRKKIADKFGKNTHIHFPNVILGNTFVCEDVKMGKGCIVSMDSRISTNVKLGDFVFMNTGSMVCHDGKIGDFVTLSPDVKLAGNVSVGACTDIGIGTKVIQETKIGEHVIVGAGSVVIRDMESHITAVGVPARKIRGNE